MMFIVAFTVCLLPMKLSALPGWFPTEPVGVWQRGVHSFRQPAQRLQEWLAYGPQQGMCIQSQRAASHSRHTWQHCICHHRLSWARPITHAPRSSQMRSHCA